MKRHCIFLILLFIAGHALAQPPQLIFCEGNQQNYTWAKAMASDVAGNMFIAGYGTGLADFDFGPGSAYISSFSTDYGYLASYDFQGRFRWFIGLTPITISGRSRIHAIATDDSANVYISGTMLGGTVDFDPDPAEVHTLPTINGSGFIVKYDSTGDFKWAYQVNLDSPAITGNIYPHHMAFDGEGIIITGYMGGTVDFDPGPGTNLHTAVNQDVCIVKVTRNGQYDWAYAFGGTVSDEGHCVLARDSGEVYISGLFRGTNIDFDPSAAAFLLSSFAPTASDAFVTRINSWSSPGSPDFFKWAFRVGGNGFDNGKEMQVDSLSNLYLGIQHTSSVIDLDPSTSVNSTSNHGADDIAIASYDLQYMPTDPQFYRWGFALGCYEENHLEGMAIDGKGNIYVAANNNDCNIDLDPSAGTAIFTSTHDVLISSYDSMGMYRWGKVCDGVSGRIHDINYNHNALFVHTSSVAMFTTYINFDLGTGAQPYNFALALAKYGDTCIGAGVPLLADTTICTGQAVTLSATGNLNDAVYWNWYTGSCDSLLAQGNALTIAPTDTVTLCVKGSGHCTSSDSAATITINVVPLPLVDFSGLPASVCSNSAPVHLTPSHAGGVFSGSTGISASQFIPANATVGTNAITYTYTNALGCTNSVTHSVLVNALPTVDIIGTLADTICTNNATNTIWAAPAGGTYSGAPGITPIGSGYAEFDPGAVLPGDYTISYTYISPVTGCTNSDSFNVAVLEPPVVSITSPSYFFCYTDPGSVQLDVSPAGGTFYGASITAPDLFYPSHNGVGTHYVQYIYTDAHCSNRDTAVIVVDLCTAVEEPAAMPLLQVFPDPASDYLNVVAASSFSAILVRDMQGKICFSYNNTPGETAVKLDIATMERGVYILSVTTPAGIVNRKFVRQ